MNTISNIIKATINNILTKSIEQVSIAFKSLQTPESQLFVVVWPK